MILLRVIHTYPLCLTSRNIRSGEFTMRGKAWEAIRSNLYFFLFAFVVSIIFIIYMVAAHGSSSAVEFVGLTMAMGNTYGVVLIICLLGKVTLSFCILSTSSFHSCNSISRNMLCNHGQWQATYLHHTTPHHPYTSVQHLLPPHRVASHG